MTQACNFSTREAWLDHAAEVLDAVIDDAGGVMVAVRPSVGLPSKRALSAKHRRIGEYWTPDASADGVGLVFISPLLDDPVEILAVLLHEKIHASVGVEAGHGKLFSRLARKCGLTGKMTATIPGEELKVRLERIAKELGPYPQPNFDPKLAKRKVQSTRMIKLQVHDCPCGYTVRTTKKWIDEGVPKCPHGFDMEPEVSDALED